MSISGWIYDHTGGFLGSPDAPPKGASNTNGTGTAGTDTSQQKSTLPNGNSKTSNDPNDDSDSFLITLEAVFDGLTNLVKAIRDALTGNWSAAIEDGKKVAEDASKIFGDGKKGKDSSNTDAEWHGNSSNDNSPSFINNVRGWIANRAAPKAKVEIVYNAAIKNGLTPQDAGVLATIVQRESAWDWLAHSSLSSAKGGFQFKDATARALHIENPYDPVEASEGAARLYIDLRKGLADKFHGGDVTKVDHWQVDLAWQFGKSGAEHLLDGDPNQKAVDALWNAGERNPQKALSGNLTEAFKNANPNWVNMTKGQLLYVMETNYNNREQAVIAANAGALHLTPAANQNPQQPVETAQLTPPAKPTGTYRGVMPPPPAPDGGTGKKKDGDDHHQPAGALLPEPG